jgi:hypothetical protein
MANFLKEISKVPLLDSQPFFFFFFVARWRKFAKKKKNCGTNVGGGSLGGHQIYPEKLLCQNILRNRQAGLAESAGTSFNF